MAPRVGVVGSCNVDFHVRCAALPRPGETVLGGDVERLPGGKGGNQASAAARLGAATSMMASVGRDDGGDWLVAELEGYGVDASRVSRSRRPTGTAFIAVAPNGQNQIVVSPGANADLDLTGVDLSGFDVVLAQLEVEDSVIDDVAARSSTFVLNAAPARPINPATLARCAVVIANELEAESLDLRAIASCVVTLGAHGVLYLEHGRQMARELAPSVDAVDTVGAGDVFCAAYAIEVALGTSVEEALRFAATAAALATLAHGAQGALPLREEVKAWLARA